MTRDELIAKFIGLTRDVGKTRQLVQRGKFAQARRMFSDIDRWDVPSIRAALIDLELGETHTAHARERETTT